MNELRVLIVEDQRNIAMGLKEKLLTMATAVGLSVEIFVTCSYEEAYTSFEKQVPDLISLDGRFPFKKDSSEIGENGKLLAQRIKAIHEPFPIFAFCGTREDFSGIISEYRIIEKPKFEEWAEKIIAFLQTGI